MKPITMTMLARRAILLSSAAAMAGLSAPAYAQDEQDDQPPVQAEADLADTQDPAGDESIVVTGSRIARRDLTSTSPICSCRKSGPSSPVPRGAAGSVADQLAKLGSSR